MATGVPSDSKMPLGWPSLGAPSVPLQPMAQFIVPGGCWMWKVGAVEFQATAHPMVQPWPEPRMLRSMNSMLPASMTALSTSSPVAQRWCGWMGDLESGGAGHGEGIGPRRHVGVGDGGLALRGWFPTCGATLEVALGHRGDVV